MTSRPLSLKPVFTLRSMASAAVPVPIGRLLTGAVLALCCIGLATAQEAPTVLSSEGMRATAADIAVDQQGTAWVLWVQKGERIPGAGHASADYMSRSGPVTPHPVSPSG